MEIYTHKLPDVDAIVSAWFLIKYGKRKYGPEIRKAKVCFASKVPMGQKVISVDIPGGTFDHHGQEIDQCSADLVAEYLGISDVPELQKILRYTHINDTRGQSGPFDLAQLLKAMRNSHSDEEIFKMGFSILDIFYEEAHKFAEAEREFEQNGRWIEMPVRDKKKLKIALIHTNNRELQKWLRNEKKADVVIVRNESGHVQIFLRSFNRKPLLDTAIIGNALQSAEKDGLNDKWFVKPVFILNGSETRKDVLPTTLNDDEILSAIIDAIG